MKKPTPSQFVRYAIGQTLPEDLTEWVRDDLVGPGAERRWLLRFFIPTLPWFAFVFLFPGPIGIKIAMLAMMVVPFVVFTVALSYVWRRFRLAAHGLDPHLLDASKFKERDRLAYQARFGHM
ncbi:DUF5313 family protein [Antrihabitans sp. YC2-6]|uniref:DUF5313 family protein n=1 Tax=Antrihabitans sp. YC2-6 TaxID=2799498 RepID=UPI0018F2FAF5|nr:DUF5313 family protein [Antrihabitans sp. YC2-6]MBJ8345242.1 DUF5313 family protein [Antrihabitans sp. YC2-6]